MRLSKDCVMIMLYTEIISDKNKEINEYML